MKNPKVFISVLVIALVAWALLLMAFFSNEEKKPLKSISMPKVVSQSPAVVDPVSAEIPVVVEPVHSGTPVIGVSSVASAKKIEPKLASQIAKKPRKTLSSFNCIGEICVDVETGEILFGKNIDIPHPPASVTKLMTLYVVLDEISKKKLSLDDVIVASARAQGMGGTQVYLATGEKCVVKDLLYALMVESANDAAVALAEKISGTVEGFVEIMNAEAKKLGMNHSTFSSPHGLPATRKERATGKLDDMTTANDLSKVAIALLTRFPESADYFSEKTKLFPVTNLRSKPLPMRNHNKLLSSFAGCDGMKTGWTNKGASIVTTASRGNKRVVAVILGGLVKNKKGEIDAKSSQTERNQRAAELMYDGFKKIDVLKYEPTPYR